ncbi:MAG: adenylate/guanylate cyclase domain-containing protein [Pseudomonadota bacterium]
MRRPAYWNIKARAALTLGFGLLLALTGLIVYALPGGFALEENIALDVLFKQRGQRAPPEQVMLVSIDKTAAEQLGMAEDGEVWPREYHARLIDRLSEAGASVIVFDMFFHRPRDGEETARLARSMRSAGNVVVFAKLEREVQSIPGGAYNLERVVPPLPVIHDAAAAAAPFALPKVPVKVNQFWTFQAAAGDVPTMPAVALALYAKQDQPRLFELLQERYPQHTARWQAVRADPDIKGRLAQLREFFRQHPALGQELLRALREQPGLVHEPGASPRLQALLALCLGPERRYLNFYGPPRSITTVPYHQVLDPEADLTRFKDKVVFVGFSEERQPEQKDSFYTVYSQSSGLDLSGVEIAATAFANLLAQESLRMPEMWDYLALIVFFGLALASLNMLPSARVFVAACVVMGAIYGLICLYAFARHGYWLPLFIPVLVQTPLALFLGLAWRHQQLKRERARIRQAFGYYLPESVVEELARDARRLAAPSERMYGVCMATDAAQYTRLAESLAPEELASYMNEYYACLFKPVREHGGIISDVVGDAMLAIWSARAPERRLRRQACMAALEALHAGADAGRLQTRLGLHAGEIMLGNIGALDHYEYRAVGDIVNTASRIEGLNKQLGTSLLVTGEVLADLDGFVSRELGMFRLAGKQQPLVIHELLGLEAHCGERERALCRHFSQGLHAYRRQECRAAMVEFQRALTVRPDDGPSRFFLQRCEQHARGDLPWPADGVIVVPKK